MKKTIKLFFSLIILPLCGWAQDVQEAQPNAETQQVPQPQLPDSLVAAEPQTEGQATSTSASTTTPLDPEVLAQQGDSAYMADNFSQAEERYLHALKEGGSSTALFYNLGNVYYRQGNLGMAIVSYERALKLDPTNSDAKANLEFVNSKITDRQIDSGTVMSSIWGTVVGGFKADTWAWIAIVLFAIFLGCVAVYVFASAVWLRKFSFFGGLIVFFLTAVGIIIVFAAANRVTSHDEGIILPPAAQLSTLPREPRNQTENAFLLHEGTKVELIDSISNPGEGTWYEVRVGGRERAWVKASEVERI